MVSRYRLPGARRSRSLRSRYAARSRSRAPVQTRPRRWRRTGRWPSPWGVGQPKPGGDHHGQRPGRGRRGVPGSAEQAAIEVDEAEEAETQAGGEDQNQWREAAIAPPDRCQRRFDRHAGMAENVPEQKQENAGGDRVEHSLYGAGHAANTSDGKADEDGGARDGAEPGGGGVAQAC